MSEGEATEVIGIFIGNAITSFTVYITFTFGYLTVAYLVGPRLTRFQVIATSGMYLVSATSALLSLLANDLAWQAIKSSTVTVLDQVPFLSARFWMIYMTSIMMLGMAVSLYFMLDVRRRAHGRFDT